ncbi:MFS transporter [Paenibacillus sp. B01]|uniref:MFS transporter n=1 Tax=Paenibacillus sp. B01 TaxID=2660554 RepID=UPI00129B604E|nr:MFS transporter [Paenibacillus sp. B01]QGG56822.1 MFS transporter [Paenibacillus sp. B01]
MYGGDCKPADSPARTGKGACRSVKLSLPKNSKKIIRSPFVIKLLIIMFGVEFVKGAMLVSVLPVYMRDELGLTAYAVGWALASQYIGDNFFRSPLGWIIDRIGYRTVMLLGVLFTGLSVLVIALTDQTGWIIVACVLLGIGTSPLWPCVITGATAVAGDEAGGSMMSVIYMSWLVGVGMGPIVINFFIISRYEPAFWLMGAIMAAIVAVTMTLPGRRASREIEGRLADEAPSKSSGPLPERIRAYFRKVGQSLHASRLLYPAMFIQNFALGLLTPVLTQYARTVLHLSPQQYSYFLLAGGAITVLGLIPIGRGVDRYGTRWFLHAGFLLAAVSLPVLGYMRYLPLVLVVVAVVGLGYACIIPAWNALIAKAIPKEERGAVWGFFLTIEGLGMVFGSILSGRLWDSFGPHAPFLISGASLVVLFVLHLLIIRRGRISLA